MADNYLERAMEDLYNGRYNKTSSSGSSVRYKDHVYIRDVAEYGIENVRKLVRGGYKVSFSFPEGHEGSRLARTLRCHYRPLLLGIPKDARQL